MKGRDVLGKLTRAHAGVMFLTVLISGVHSEAIAYEGDVHYGLTQWLALKTGFDADQAKAIALGNYRVDSGAMQSLEVIFDYACSIKNKAVAQKMADIHFPSAAQIPSPSSSRTVEAGGPAARGRIEGVLRGANGQEGQRLGMFGAALHTLQDSWSHAGPPSAPTLFGAGVTCESEFASGHPENRGGPHSHDADLTYAYPGDVIPMAKATYDAMAAYPLIDGRQRTVHPWNELVAEVARFARGRTKSEKRDWFVAEGISATDFLEGASLPNGLAPGSLQFTGRSLPTLKDIKSTQWDAPEDARHFFDRLLTRWLGTEKIEAVVTDLAGSPEGKSAAAHAKHKARLQQLSARMSLWKLSDHGSASGLAHVSGELTPQQLAMVAKLTSAKSVVVQHSQLADAFLPLLAKGDKPSPLLAYVVRVLPTVRKSGPARAIAFSRLKHAPYDTVGWVAEQTESGWVIVDMVWTVDH